MKTVKINGKKYTYETDVSNITFKTFIAKFKQLLEVQNDAAETSIYDNIQLVSIILGCDYAEAMDAPAEVTADLLFWKDFELLKQDIPEYIELDDKKIKVSKNLTRYKLTAGQLEYFRQMTLNIRNKLAYPELSKVVKKIVEKEDLTPDEILRYNKYILDEYSEYCFISDKLCACMLQSIIFGRFRPQKNENFAKKLQDLPFSEVIPLAFFLISRCMQFLTNKANN